MTSRYTECLLAILPIGRRTAGRLAIRGLEQGDILPGSDSREEDLFVVGFSPNGQSPATHVGVGPKVTPRMRERVAEQIEPLPGVCWARVSNPESRLLATNAAGAPPEGTPFTWGMLAGNCGLLPLEG